MPRLRWGVTCRAHLSDGSGEPCSAFSIRGGYVCAAHGGRLPQVQQRARLRLEAAREYRAELARLPRDEWRWWVEMLTAPSVHPARMVRHG